MKQSGFSLVELVVVTFFFIVLAGYAIINLPRILQKAAIHVSVDTVVSDLRQQQIKAMTGDTEGRGSLDHYGIYFQTNSYTLFHGATYNPNDLANQNIPFQNNMQLMTISFPNASVIFTKGSGEILGFVNGSNTLILKNTVSNEIKTITINRYGVVTLVN